MGVSIWDAMHSEGQTSEELSRWPGSMERRTKDIVAPLRWSAGWGWVTEKIGRMSAGIGHKYPVTIRKTSLITGSMRRVWAQLHQAGAQYSAVEWTRAKLAVRNFVAPAPQPEPESRFKMVTRDINFLRSDSRCYMSDLSNVTPRFWAQSRRRGFCCCGWLLAHG